MYRTQIRPQLDISKQSPKLLLNPGDLSSSLVYLWTDSLEILLLLEMPGCTDHFYQMKQ